MNGMYPDTPDLPLTVEAEQTHVRIPSLPEWIEQAVDFFQQKAVLCGVCGHDRLGKLGVALHEAITNSVVHGNLEVESNLKEQSDGVFAAALARRTADPAYSLRPVHIVVDYDGQRCRWIVTDQGRGFDVQRVLQQPTDDEAGFFLASGRGILIMRSFLDEVRYELGGRRVILTMNKLASEQRQHERLPFQKPVRVAPLRTDGSVDWEASYEAVSQDLSAGGIGILQARLETTDRIIIGICTGGEPVYIPAQVCHTQVVGDGVVELGCRFETSSTAAPLQPDQALGEIAKVGEAIGKLLESIQTTDAPRDERREHTRVVYAERVGIRSEADPVPAFAYARDLSKSGVALISTFPVPIQAVRVVHLPQQQGPPLCVRVRIVRCTRLFEGFYDIAGHFIGMEEQPGGS